MSLETDITPLMPKVQTEAIVLLADAGELANRASLLLQRSLRGAASLISGTAAAHQPVWHSDRDGQHFASSMAAYRQ